MSNDNGTQDHSPETGLDRARDVITEVSKILDAAGMSFLVAISTPATIEVGGERAAWCRWPWPACHPSPPRG